MLHIKIDMIQYRILKMQISILWIKKKKNLCTQIEQTKGNGCVLKRAIQSDSEEGCLHRQLKKSANPVATSLASSQVKQKMKVVKDVIVICDFDI